MSHKKTIKAWAVVDEKGLLFASKEIEPHAIFYGDNRTTRREDCRILSCLVTYELPKPRPTSKLK